MSWIEVDVQGRKIRVAILASGGGAWVAWEGQAWKLDFDRPSAAKPEGVEREIRAPMTGRVAKVSVTPGAAVHARDLLVTLEAMKMEYRLVAPRDGTVESVGCKEGELVDLGRVLATLAP